jgi:uncharacterized membrane protein YbhN (UPF0104 family)
MMVPDNEITNRLRAVLQRWCPCVEELNAENQIELVNEIATGIGGARLWGVTIRYGVLLTAALLFAIVVVSDVIQSAEKGNYNPVPILVVGIVVAAIIVTGRLFSKELRKRSQGAFVDSAARALESRSLDYDTGALAAAGEDYYCGRPNSHRPVILFLVAEILLFLCLLPFRYRFLGADGDWLDLLVVSYGLLVVFNVIAGGILYLLSFVFWLAGYHGLSQRCGRPMAKLMLATLDAAKPNLVLLAIHCARDCAPS